jgi:hypothetical protein
LSNARRLIASAGYLGIDVDETNHRIARADHVIE